MRLYDETCLALCEGQYIDIATSESDELMSVELYFDMIGRKTAALIAASIEAGALLATDDEDGHRALPRLRLGARLAFQLNDDLLGHLGRRAGDRQGAVRHRPQEEDAAGHLRRRARRARGPRSARGAVRASRPDGRRASPRSSRSSSGRGARDYTRDEARRHRDEALAELDAAGVVDREARARLEEIIVSVIAA